MSGADHLTKRNGFWHFYRRIPAEFAHVDGRPNVKETTKIRVADDPRGLRAGQIAERKNAELEMYWRGLIEGRAMEAKARYDAARRRARAMGFDYATAADLAASRSTEELVARMEALLAGNKIEREVDVAAALGGETPPEILLSTLFEEYRGLELAATRDFSVDQVRKWANPRKKAVNDLIVAIGDKPLHKVSPADALDFQLWLQDRVVEEDLQIASANKEIGAINRMWATVDKAHRLGLPPHFTQLRIRGQTTGQRAAFKPDFVQKVILAEGALADLNEEARRIVYLMAETGLRLSEACNLRAGTIRLDDAVPHVIVAADERRLKTAQSARAIPLVGVALAAVQAQPDGFPRYRDKGGTLSALLNKFFGAHGMRPTPDHSAYSLRHTFEDRLTAVEAPEKLIAALMGHKYSRPKYGAGPSLEQKQEWLQKVAFRGPATV